jgi:hypothetical protein
MSGRYGEPRRRAQLELRAAAAQFVVDAELMVRWLDQLGGEPAAAQVLEERQAQVLRCARSFEAALNHVVNLELLAADRPSEALAADRPSEALAAERPPGPEGLEASGAEPEPKTRRTIPIVGDPDKPKRDQPASGHRSPTARTNGETEDTGRPTAEPESSASA